MYDITEIEKIVSNVIEVTLEHENIVKKMIRSDKNYESGYPNYNPVYRRSVELEEEMEVHMEAKHFPFKLFKSKAPNENPEEYAYRIAQFQPVTKPFMNRAFRTINRIWNESNYTINWKDNESHQYFTKTYPKHKSIIAFFRSLVTKFKLKDPNGVIVIKPRVLPTIQDQDGNLKADQSAKIEPVAVLYESCQVINFLEDQYALIELKEKSLVTFGTTQVREGRIFEFYDENKIWKITQVGKKVDYTFTFDIYYEHALGVLPVTKLKGEPCNDEDNIIYESYLMPAIPNLNIALYNHNTLEMSITNDAFPQRWEYVDPCNYEGCEGGWIVYDKENDKKAHCPNCKGTGHTERHSPMGVKQVYIGDRLTQGAEGLSMPPAGYIAPDTATLEFRHSKYLKDVEQAFAFLNIDVSNSDVKGTENTALGKKIDREELFSFLLLISDEQFDLLSWTIDLSGKMRYGNFEIPEITKPIDFSIRSNEELIEEMVAAKEALVPDIVIQKQLKEYALSRFNTSKEVTKFLDIVFKTDRLLTLTQEDIVLQKTTGSVLTWEIILHTSIYTFLEQSIIEDEKFLEKDFKDQKKLLEQKAKDKEKEIKKESSLSVDNILNKANGEPIETPVDIEAEAKANLKGSVGGVQGILAIQMQVSQGVTDYESAVTLLFEIYGFDDATARKMLGSKDKLLKANANAPADNS